MLTHTPKHFVSTSYWQSVTIWNTWIHIITWQLSWKRLWHFPSTTDTCS